MRKFLAYGVSIALHVGVLLLALISLHTHHVPLEVSSVPVEIVTDMPSRQMAEAPVDPLAVKTPSPEPAPDEVVKPPEPEPAPPMPVPEPQKAKSKPELDKSKKPTAKEGTKKAPVSTNDFDPTKYAVGSSPSKAQTKKPVLASNQRTTGASNFGNAPADTGAAMNALTNKLQKLWSPNCDVPGAREVKARIVFTISPSGRVIKGPEWSNRVNDPVWEAGAARAMQAVKRGELYDDLPEALYNREMAIYFDASKACRGQ